MCNGCATEWMKWANCVNSLSDFLDHGHLVGCLYAWPHEVVCSNSQVLWVLPPARQYAVEWLLSLRCSLVTNKFGFLLVTIIARLLQSLTAAIITFVQMACVHQQPWAQLYPFTTLPGMWKQGRLAPKHYAVDNGLYIYCACDIVQPVSWLVLMIHCSPTLQPYLDSALTNLIHMHYVLCKRRPKTYRFLHTHSVLLRLPLTTADEKLSKVTAPW